MQKINKKRNPIESVRGTEYHYYRHFNNLK